MAKPLGIQNLTDNDKATAKTALNNWPENNSVAKLFGLYHLYVAASPSDQKCGICKSHIKKFWTNYLK
jgi:hypothetical protein